MVLNFPPICLYILESESTKTFYASHVHLKYKTYKEGNIDGEWLRYYNDGKLIEKKIYRNGKLIKNIKP